jgi:hypothetical protein
MRTLKNSRSLLGFALALFYSAVVAAAAVKNTPATGTPEAFFGSTNLYTIHLTIAADQWKLMNQVELPAGGPGAPRGNRNRPGGFQPGPPMGGGGFPPSLSKEFKEGVADLEFQGQPFGAIHARFKGNSSFRFAGKTLKCSLKLDFNDLKKGQTFFGLRKLNLNNNAMDPSQLREALAYDILRTGGLAASRTAFVKVYVTVPGRHDRAYAGLYTAVEQVDEHFLKDRFSTKQGLLMKPEGQPGLPYLGDGWAAYTNGLQPKTAVASEDASRFIEFVKFLNRADDKQFRATVAEYVDVDEFLRFLALEGLLANMDSPLMTGHNYYLYLQPKSRKLVWIPWDMNEAFGGFMAGGGMAEQVNLSLDQPFTRVNRLAERLLQMPGVKDRYHELIHGLLATNFNSARLFPIIDAMAATIRPALADDLMVSPPQFESAVAEGSPAQADLRANGPGGMGRPRMPLKAFITQRASSAQLQLEGKATGHVPKEMGPGGPFGGGRPFRPEGRP